MKIKTVMIFTFVIIIGAVFSFCSFPVFQQNFESFTNGTTNQIKLGLHYAPIETSANLGFVTNINGDNRFIFVNDSDQRVIFTNSPLLSNFYLEFEYSILAYGTTTDTWKGVSAEFKYKNESNHLYFMDRFPDDLNYRTRTNNLDVYRTQKLNVAGENAINKVAIFCYGYPSTSVVCFFNYTNAFSSTVSIGAIEKGRFAFKNNSDKAWIDNIKVFDQNNFPVFVASSTISATNITFNLSNSFNMNRTWILYRSTDQLYENSIPIDTKLQNLSSFILTDGAPLAGITNYYWFSIQSSPYRSTRHEFFVPEGIPSITCSSPISGSIVRQNCLLKGTTGGTIPYNNGDTLTIYYSSTDGGEFLPGDATFLTTITRTDFNAGKILDISVIDDGEIFLYISAVNGGGSTVKKINVSVQSLKGFIPDWYEDFDSTSPIVELETGSLPFLTNINNNNVLFFSTNGAASLNTFPINLSNFYIEWKSQGLNWRNSSSYPYDEMALRLRYHNSKGLKLLRRNNGWIYFHDFNYGAWNSLSVSDTNIHEWKVALSGSANNLRYSISLNNELRISRSNISVPDIPDLGKLLFINNSYGKMWVDDIKIYSETNFPAKLSAQTNSFTNIIIQMQTSYGFEDFELYRGLTRNPKDSVNINMFTKINTSNFSTTDISPLSGTNVFYFAAPRGHRLFSPPLSVYIPHSKPSFTMLLPSKNSIIGNEFQIKAVTGGSVPYNNMDKVSIYISKIQAEFLPTSAIFITNVERDQLFLGISVQNNGWVTTFTNEKWFLYLSASNNQGSTIKNSEIIVMPSKPAIAWRYPKISEIIVRDFFIKGDCTGYTPYENGDRIDIFRSLIDASTLPMDHILITNVSRTVLQDGFFLMASNWNVGKWFIYVSATNKYGAILSSRFVDVRGVSKAIPDFELNFSTNQVDSIPGEINYITGTVPGRVQYIDGDKRLYLSNLNSQVFRFIESPVTEDIYLEYDYRITETTPSPGTWDGVGVRLRFMTNTYFRLLHRYPNSINIRKSVPTESYITQILSGRSYSEPNKVQVLLYGYPEMTYKIWYNGAIVANSTVNVETTSGLNDGIRKGNFGIEQANVKMWIDNIRCFTGKNFPIILKEYFVNGQTVKLNLSGIVHSGLTWEIYQNNHDDFNSAEKVNEITPVFENFELSHTGLYSGTNYFYLKSKNFKLQTKALKVIAPNCPPHISITSPIENKTYSKSFYLRGKTFGTTPYTISDKVSIYLAKEYASKIPQTAILLTNVSRTNFNFGFKVESQKCYEGMNFIYVVASNLYGGTMQVSSFEIVDQKLSNGSWHADFEKVTPAMTHLVNSASVPLEISLENSIRLTYTADNEQVLRFDDVSNLANYYLEYESRIYEYSEKPESSLSLILRGTDSSNFNAIGRRKDGAYLIHNINSITNKSESVLYDPGLLTSDRTYKTGIFISSYPNTILQIFEDYAFKIKITNDTFPSHGFLGVYNKTKYGWIDNIHLFSDSNFPLTVSEVTFETNLYVAFNTRYDFLMDYEVLISTNEEIETGIILGRASKSLSFNSLAPLYTFSAENPFLNKKCYVWVRSCQIPMYKKIAESEHLSITSTKQFDFIYSLPLIIKRSEGIWFKTGTLLSSPYTINIFNMQGKAIYSENFKNNDQIMMHNIISDNFQIGSYIIVLSTIEKLYIKQLIVLVD